MFPGIVQVPLNGPHALKGTLWTSKRTKRSGRVLWASGGLVKLVYSETDPNAYKIMAETDLTNLYDQTK